MLAPDGRALLLDALRPPVGYVLDQAVATTFTLDLETALTVPLAFAGYTLRESRDTIELLEAIRSSADNINIFCQAGAIQASHWPSDLVGLLERALHQVPRPKPGCIFHPKIWVIRYREREEGTATYRCLVLSRNLTADRSWDVVLRLDSDDSTTRVNAGNDGLNRLLLALPGMAGMPSNDPRARAVAALAEDIRRVTWEMPEDVKEIAFYPFGLPGMRRQKTHEMFQGYRHLIVSPFITIGGVAIVVGDESNDLSIISRADELDKLPGTAFPGTKIFSISPTVASLGDSAESDQKIDTDRMLSDLHAKLYVVESNRVAHVYVGSANATENGLDGNIEILCRLSGGATKLGVECMLGEKAPLREILEPYSFPAEPVTDTKADLTYLIESYLIDIAGVGLEARATEAESGWFIQVTSVPLPAPPEKAKVALYVSPFNRPADSRAAQPGESVNATFGPVLAADLTPFFVVHCRAEIEGEKIEYSVVIRARLTGDPEKRLDDIIVRQIDTPEKFLRLLSVLLGLVSGGMPGFDETKKGYEPGGVWAAGGASGILETLVRALAENPGALDRLDGIVGRLCETEEGRKVLPPGWSELWAAVTAAKGMLGREI